MKKTLLIIASITLLGCKKEAKEVINTVTYHCFSENGHATLKYVDEANNWKTVNVTTLDLTVKMKPENMHWVSTLQGVGTDSLFISADCNGKHQQQAFRNSSGNSSLTISLNELK
jgi:hypothetical protein